MSVCERVLAFHSIFKGANINSSFGLKLPHMFCCSGKLIIILLEARWHPDSPELEGVVVEMSLYEMGQPLKIRIR